MNFLLRQEIGRLNDRTLAAFQKVNGDIEEIRSKQNIYDLEWKNNPEEMVRLQNTTKIIVEKPDEFLRSFGITDLKDPQIMTWLHTIAQPQNRIGTAAVSGFGALYNVPGQDYVMKIVNVCPTPAPQANTLAGQMCNMARQGDLIFRFPNTQDKKMIIWAPNYIIEAIMGVFLSRMKLYTPSFMRVYGLQYNTVPVEKPLYVVAERLVMADTRIIDTKTYLYSMFQIAQGLNTAQVLHRYTHYDLHDQNFMVRVNPNPNIKIYELGDGRYFYTKSDFDTVIIDYGLNRMETVDSILTPRARYERREIERWDILEHGAFNPYIDFFELAHMCWKRALDNRRGRSFPNWANQNGNANITLAVLKLFLDVPGITDQFLDDLLRNHIMSQYSGGLYLKDWPLPIQI